MKNPKEKAEQLVDESMQTVIFNIKQNINVSTINVSKEVALLCVSKQLELLRYLGSVTPNELHDWLIKQKVEIQKL